MATTYSKTAIALQGGGALGAYSFGALKYIYESEPDLRLSSISGVSVGAFTAAIVASHPDNPIDHLQSFWKDLTVFHSKLLRRKSKDFLLILVIRISICHARTTTIGHCGRAFMI
jgi:NTE family protein